jgi:hypothetical protein
MTVPLLVVGAPYVFDLWRRHTLATTGVLLASVVLAAIGGVVVSNSSTVQSVESKAFPLSESPAHAVVSALSNGTDHQAPELLLAAFLIIGVAACFVWRQRRWLVCAELAIVALYVGSAAIGSHAARIFTGLWYDDAHRIAATLPIVAIPLATMGVLAVGEWLHRAAARSAIAARPALAMALPLAVGAGVAVTTAVQSLPANASVVGWGFSTSGNQELTSPKKLQFLQTVARLVPGSAVVADDPFAGSAYLFALSGRRVLFPQMAPSYSQDLIYLAHNLARLSQDPLVCNLVRRYAVGYMLVAPDNYLEKSQLPGFYGGVAYPAEASGFRLMAADGPLRLYKITSCQPESPSASPAEAASRGSS